MPYIDGRCPHFVDPLVRVPYTVDSWRSFLSAFVRAQFTAWRMCRHYERAQRSLLNWQDDIS
jgi:hypothetical protein